MVSLLEIPMLTAVAMTAQVLPLPDPMPPAEPATVEVCLGRGSAEMEMLLGGVQRTVSRTNERSDEVRSALGLEKRAAADVVPVMSDSICARALRILKAELGDRASVSESVAVVSVGGKYVARYRYRPALRAAGLPEVVVTTFYFNGEFTEVAARTW